MTSVSASTTADGRALHSPAGVFASVLNVAVGYAAGKVERKVAGWTNKLQGVAAGSDAADGLSSVADAGLDELAEDGGAAEKASAEGLKAGLHGENPIVAAIKGAWKSGTPAVRAAIVTAAGSAILLLLLSPVLGLIFLVSLLIIAAVHRAREAKT